MLDGGDSNAISTGLLLCKEAELESDFFDFLGNISFVFIFLS
jgi:hypothetical protein